MIGLINKRMLSSNLKGSAKKWMDRHLHDPYVKMSRLVI